MEGRARRGSQNYNIAVKKRGDDITFLRRIVRGGADDSYGIEVAKLAGIPEGVIRRSKQILQELDAQGAVALPIRPVAEEEPQLSLASAGAQRLADELRGMDVEYSDPPRGVDQAVWAGARGAAAMTAPHERAEG